MKVHRIISVLIAITLLSSCGGNNIAVFTVEDDSLLGQKLVDRIETDSTYSVLSRADYAFAYNYLELVRDQILASDTIRYQEDFEWEMNILHDDEVVNAFILPGGYMYVYTGLIKFLETEDELAGVLAHVMAHADRRHVSQQMQREYGITLLHDIISGKETNQLNILSLELAGVLKGFNYSRALEIEADAFSVWYLSNTDYACNSPYTFFEKFIVADSTTGPPEFLNTHPDPINRIANINVLVDEIRCSISLKSPPTYESFKTSLPE